MDALFKKLWNFDFSGTKALPFLFLAILVVLGGSVYVLLEVWFGLAADSNGFTILNVWPKLTVPQNGALTLEGLFPLLWLSITVISITVRLTVIFHSYVQSQKAVGNAFFSQLFTTYTSSFFLGLLLEFTLIFLLSALGVWAGLKIEMGTNIITSAVQWLHTTINNLVPNLMQIQSYWLALSITILVSGLPLYFVHWLSHKSRFVWYVFHRAHHCPQYLHPLAAPPAFAFGFLLALPGGLVTIAISKLIYTEPMVMEVALWFAFGYSLEIFNHASVSYQFALRNFFVRNLSRLYGDRGVYHLMHHSSKPGDEMINLSSGPLQLWDRLFGTYRKPYAKTPEVGLTNNPVIVMNPFRVMLGGIAQLGYELKMNPDFTTRWKMLFGDIYYKPPITKDYLIVGYQQATDGKALANQEALAIE